MLMYYVHASFASSQICLITQNKGTHRISAPANNMVLYCKQYHAQDVLKQEELIFYARSRI